MEGSSPAVGANGRVWKKVRRREDDPPDDGGDDQEMGEGMATPVSFRDAALKTNSENVNSEKEWEIEDLDLGKDDMQKCIMDGVPTIDFSERVYGLIDQIMSKTLIVKLLGRTIGYNALWNRMCAMWKPAMHFQLRDIANEYYLAKFEFETDYNNVLSRGPWVIFGHYLTVQPWSNYFTTNEEFPQRVVAWIRIPGLSSAFYKRSLLQEKRSLVGKVVKIDVQTNMRHVVNLLCLRFKSILLNL